MKNTEKMSLLKDCILKQRELAETKKAMNEEKKQMLTERDEQILGNGTMQVAKELSLKIMKKEAEIKEANADNKRIGSVIENIIMGEGDYSDDQLTIDSILNPDEE